MRNWDVAAWVSRVKERRHLYASTTGTEIFFLGCRSPHPLWPTLIGLPRNSFPDTNHSRGPAREA